MGLIFLVQHGEAKSKEEDPERHLTEKGRKDAEKVAKFLAERNIKIDKIYHSGKTRAEETAFIYAKYLNPQIVEKRENLNPLDDPGYWLDALKKEDKDIMLVGHLPFLSRLASLLLVGDSEKEIIKFEYAGCICILKENNEFKIKFLIIPSVL